MEFVNIADFNSIPMTRLTPDQTAEMIKVSARPPPERQSAIVGWRQKLGYERQSKLSAWGLEVNTQMMGFKARVLPPPAITYGGDKTLKANNGGWNLKGVKFTKPGKPLASWAVVTFDQYLPQPELAKFVNYLVGALVANGCNVTNKQPPLLNGNANPMQGYPGVKIGLQNACRDAFLQSKQNPQLVVCILPRRDTALYAQIKLVAATELKMPVVTQCLVAAKLKNERGLDQYCGNVSMKIHAKLGGLTHQIPMPNIVRSLPSMIKS